MAFKSSTNWFEIRPAGPTKIYEPLQVIGFEGAFGSKYSCDGSFDCRSFGDFFADKRTL